MLITIYTVESEGSNYTDVAFIFFVMAGTEDKNTVLDSGTYEIIRKRLEEQRLNLLERLAKLNEVAYVRFASVYRRFKDIAGFERELIHIREGRKTGRRSARGQAQARCRVL